MHLNSLSKKLPELNPKRKESRDFLVEFGVKQQSIQFEPHLYFGISVTDTTDIIFVNLVYRKAFIPFVLKLHDLNVLFTLNLVTIRIKIFNINVISINMTIRGNKNMRISEGSAKLSKRSYCRILT